MTSPSDERLVKRAANGDEHAFAQLYDRYAPRLLSFCRYLLGSREEAQDAVQQTFIRAHRAIAGGKPPEELRPWLYTVARNRCRTLRAAPRDVPVEDIGDAVALDGLADIVQRREDLRALVRDLDGLPEDQRAALVMFELGDLSQRDIGGVLDVPEAKVKALVHQARTHLIAERAARERDCDDVRAELAVARGADLRRGSLRRHVRSCPSCRAWQTDVGRQRAALGAVLPVALIGSRDAVLTALGVGAGSAGAAAGLTSAAGGAATGFATKVIAGVAALGLGAAGTEVVVQSTADPEPKRAPRVVQSAQPATPAAMIRTPPAAASATAGATNGASAPGRSRAEAVHRRNAERQAAKRRLQQLRKEQKDALKAARGNGKPQGAKPAKPTKPAAAKVKRPKPTPNGRAKAPKKPKPLTAAAPASTDPLVAALRGKRKGHEKSK